MTASRDPAESGLDKEVDYPPSLGEEEKGKGKALEGSLPIYVAGKEEGIGSILKKSCLPGFTNRCTRSFVLFVTH